MKAVEGICSSSEVLAAAVASQHNGQTHLHICLNVALLSAVVSPAKPVVAEAESVCTPRGSCLHHGTAASAGSGGHQAVWLQEGMGKRCQVCSPVAVPTGSHSLVVVPRGSHSPVAVPRGSHSPLAVPRGSHSPGAVPRESLPGRLHLGSW